MAAEVFKVTGDITINIPEVCARHNAAMPQGKDVIVDLSGVGAVDSACCAMMVLMRRTASVNGNMVTFTNLPERLTRLTELYNLDKALGVGTDGKDAAQEAAA